MITKAVAPEPAPRARERGLGRLEWVLLFVFLMAMAMLALPTVERELDAVTQRIAATDVQTLSNATDLYLREGEGVRPPPGRCVALGPGPEPRGLQGDARVVSLSEWLLATKRKGGDTPYLKTIPRDPWGHAYVVRHTPIRGGVICWVLSAGPDGVVQTESTSDTPQGDDLAVRLR